MRRPRPAGILLALCTIVSAGVMAEEVFRWVDAEGRVHFSDRAQAPNAEVMEVTPAVPADADAARESARLERTQRMLDEYAVAREEREAAEAEAKSKAAQQANRCTQARQQLAELEHSAYVYTRDADGNKVVLPPTEFRARKVKARQQAEALCAEVE